MHGRNRSTTVHQARRIITTGDHFSTELTAAPSSQMSSRLFHLSFFKKLTSHLRACQMEVQTASNSMIPKISPLQYKNGRLGKSLSTYGLLSHMSTPQKKHPSLVRNSSSCLALKRWTSVTNRSQNWSNGSPTLVAAMSRTSRHQAWNKPLVNQATSLAKQLR